MSKATSYATTVMRGAETGFTSLFGLFGRSTRMDDDESTMTSAISRMTTGYRSAAAAAQSKTGGASSRAGIGAAGRRPSSAVALCSYVLGVVCFLSAAGLTLAAGFALSWLVWWLNAGGGFGDSDVVKNMGHMDGFSMLILRSSVEIAPTSASVSTFRRNFVNVSIYSLDNDTIYQAHIKLIRQNFLLDDKPLTNMASSLVENRQPIHLCLKRNDYRLLVYYNYILVGHFAARKNANATSYEILADRPSTFKIFSTEQTGSTKKGITTIKHPTNIKSAEIIFHVNSCAKFNLIFKSEISNHVTASFTCDPTKGECVIGYLIEYPKHKNETDRIDKIKFDAVNFFARDLCVFRLFRKLKPSHAYKITVNEMEFENYVVPEHYEPPKKVRFESLDEKQITIYQIDVE